MLAPRTSTTTATIWPPLSMAEPDVCAPIDANGHLIGDGSRTFEWDARNQLVAISFGTHRSEFTYDGERRRVHVVEKENGVTQSGIKVVWCNENLCEERQTDGTTIDRGAFKEGEKVDGIVHLFTADHLGSLREVTTTSNAVVGRYAYDSWGNRSVESGTDVTSTGYTGHNIHSATGLTLTKYRVFDSLLGRWLSEDPIGLRAGPNFYGYVQNAPLTFVDPLGLQCTEVMRIPLGTWRSRTSERKVGSPQIINIQVLLAPARIPGLSGAYRPQLLVTCAWQQEVIRESVVSKYYLGIFACPRQCGGTSIEQEFYSDDPHLEIERYWKRDGAKFGMPPNSISAVSDECRARAK